MGPLERKTLALRECRAAGDGSSFEGLASAFFAPDESWTCDIVAPGAFAEDLPWFLERGFVGGMNHDWDCPIGSPLHAEETAEGLFVRGSVVETAHGRDVRVLLREGVVKFLSIGFHTLAREWLETYDEVAAWWAKQGYSPTPADVTRAQWGCRLVTRIRLFEFSPVAVPAQPLAAITAVKGERSREGFSLQEHGSFVLSELEEWSARVARGPLSLEHRAGMRRVRERLDGLIRSSDTEGHRGDGADTDGFAGEQVEALFREFQALEQRLRV